MAFGFHLCLKGPFGGICVKVGGLRPFGGVWFQGHQAISRSQLKTILGIQISKPFGGVWFNLSSIGN